MADLFSCLKFLREQTTDTFTRKSKDLVYVNGCLAEDIEMRSAEHELICQHPELSLNATGIPIPVLLINTSDLEVLDDEGVADLCSVLLNASGIDLMEMESLTAREEIQVR